MIEAVLQVCAGLGTGVVPHCPQGRGLLTGGKSGSGSTDARAERHQAEPRGVSVVPIPGTRRPLHLDENLAATDIALDAADLVPLGGWLAPGPGCRHTGPLVVAGTDVVPGAPGLRLYPVVTPPDVARRDALRNCRGSNVCSVNGR
jgi:hypothetical protein